MATKAQRLEARVTAVERDRIEHAARLAGESMSGFVVHAALLRAEAIVAEQATTVAPAAYFDALLTSLDEADDAPRLARAAATARRLGQISAA